MSQFVSVEIDANSICDTMTDDHNFMMEIFTEILERMAMGLMADNLSDVSGGMSFKEAKDYVDAFSRVSDTIKNGYNMANLDQI